MGRMEATADLLSEGREPDDIDALALAERAVVRLVNHIADFQLATSGVDQPDEHGRYDREWHAVQAVRDGVHQRLHGALKEVLGCESEDGGRRCYLGLLHEGLCADGEGHSWWRERGVA